MSFFEWVASALTNDGYENQRTYMGFRCSCNDGILCGPHRHGGLGQLPVDRNCGCGNPQCGKYSAQPKPKEKTWPNL
jgi:hypothetical protein